MKNKKLLKNSGLPKLDIRLRDIKNVLTTSVNHVCFDSLEFPYRKNYFVFVVNSNGFCKPFYSVFSNPYSAIIFANLVQKKYNYLSGYHIEVVRFDEPPIPIVPYVSNCDSLLDSLLPF